MNVIKPIFILFVSLLTACAPHKVAPELPVDSTQTVNESQELSAQDSSSKDLSKGKAKSSATSISSWVISGAMAARNTKKGWTASLNWVQQGANKYQIRLFGPVGGGTVIIDKNGSVVTFADGPKKVSSRNADELLQQQTGIRLPVKNLYYWVRGLPAPGAVQSSHNDANNNLVSLTQAGYSINYSNYASIGNVNLPGKIHLQGHGVTIKLAIKRWSV